MAIRSMTVSRSSTGGWVVKPSIRLDAVAASPSSGEETCLEQVADTWFRIRKSLQSKESTCWEEEGPLVVDQSPSFSVPVLNPVENTTDRTVVGGFDIELETNEDVPAGTYHHQATFDYFPCTGPTQLPEPHPAGYMAAAFKLDPPFQTSAQCTAAGAHERRADHTAVKDFTFAGSVDPVTTYQTAAKKESIAEFSRKRIAETAGLATSVSEHAKVPRILSPVLAGGGTGQCIYDKEALVATALEVACPGPVLFAFASGRPVTRASATSLSRLKAIFGDDLPLQDIAPQDPQTLATDEEVLQGSRDRQDADITLMRTSACSLFSRDAKSPCVGSDSANRQGGVGDTVGLVLPAGAPRGLEPVAGLITSDQGNQDVAPSAHGSWSDGCHAGWGGEHHLNQACCATAPSALQETTAVQQLTDAAVLPATSQPVPGPFHPGGAGRSPSHVVPEGSCTDDVLTSKFPVQSPTAPPVSGPALNPMSPSGSASHASQTNPPKPGSPLTAQQGAITVAHAAPHSICSEVPGQDVDSRDPEWKSAPPNPADPLVTCPGPCGEGHVAISVPSDPGVHTDPVPCATRSLSMLPVPLTPATCTVGNPEPFDRPCFPIDPSLARSAGGALGHAMGPTSVPAEVHCGMSVPTPATCRVVNREPRLPVHAALASSTGVAAHGPAAVCTSAAPTGPAVLSGTAVPPLTNCNLQAPEPRPSADPRVTNPISGALDHAMDAALNSPSGPPVSHASAVPTAQIRSQQKGSPSRQGRAMPRLQDVRSGQRTGRLSVRGIGRRPPLRQVTKSRLQGLLADIMADAEGRNDGEGTESEPGALERAQVGVTRQQDVSGSNLRELDAAVQCLVPPGGVQPRTSAAHAGVECSVGQAQAPPDQPADTSSVDPRVLTSAPLPFDQEALLKECEETAANHQFLTGSRAAGSHGVAVHVPMRVEAPHGLAGCAQHVGSCRNPLPAGTHMGPTESWTFKASVAHDAHVQGHDAQVQARDERIHVAPNVTVSNELQPERNEQAEDTYAGGSPMLQPSVLGSSSLDAPLLEHFLRQDGTLATAQAGSAVPTLAKRTPLHLPGASAGQAASAEPPSVASLEDSTGVTIKAVDSSTLRGLRTLQEDQAQRPAQAGPPGGGKDSLWPHPTQAQGEDLDTPTALAPCGWTTGKGKIVQVPSAAALRKANALFSTPGKGFESPGTPTPATHLHGTGQKSSAQHASFTNTNPGRSRRAPRFVSRAFKTPTRLSTAFQEAQELNGGSKKLSRLAIGGNSYEVPPSNFNSSTGLLKTILASGNETHGCGGPSLQEGAAISKGDPSNDVGMQSKRIAELLYEAGATEASAPQEWIEHHMSWILWKLRRYERQYPHLQGSLLKQSVVLDQLKHRYEKEQIQGRRSLMRKILEGDEPPGQLMVLCVLDMRELMVQDAPGSHEHTWLLTDGWYAAAAQLDEDLQGLVRKNKLKSGDKLRICGATLQGHAGQFLGTNKLSGLQIHFNGTHKVDVSTRLGWTQMRYSFVPLHTIRPSGGLVPATMVLVQRKYPPRINMKGPKGIVRTKARSASKKPGDCYKAHGKAVQSEADVDAMLEAEEVQRCKDFLRGPSDGRDKGEELYAQAVVRGDDGIGEESAAESLLFKKAQELHNNRLSARKVMLLANKANYSENRVLTGEPLATSDMSVELLVTAVLHRDVHPRATSGATCKAFIRINIRADEELPAVDEGQVYVVSHLLPNPRSHNVLRMDSYGRKSKWQTVNIQYRAETLIYEYRPRIGLQHCNLREINSGDDFDFKGVIVWAGDVSECGEMQSQWLFLVGDTPSLEEEPGWLLAVELRGRHGSIEVVEPGAHLAGKRVWLRDLTMGHPDWQNQFWRAQAGENSEIEVLDHKLSKEDAETMLKQQHRVKYALGV
eukprot:jgi/Botrbrau1/21443/Bobra.0216s0051.1